MNRTISGYLVQVINRRFRSVTATCVIDILTKIPYDTHVAQILYKGLPVCHIYNLNEAKGWLERNMSTQPEAKNQEDIVMHVFSKQNNQLVFVWSLAMIDDVDFDRYYVSVLGKDTYYDIRTKEEAEDFILTAEQNAAWKPCAKETINPVDPRSEYGRCDYDSFEKNLLDSEKVIIEKLPSGFYVFAKEDQTYCGSLPDAVLLDSFDFENKYVIHTKKEDGVCVVIGSDKLYQAWKKEYMSLPASPKQDNTISDQAVDKIAKAVDPSHYKLYILEMEWIDAMSKIPTLRKPERFIAALELQIRKYLDRNGGKDEPLQELKKAQFYLAYLIAYIANGYQIIPSAAIKAKLKLLEV